MRAPAKIVTWTVVFAACAGLGAYVAAHTDPFPPGVTDPGERPSPTSSSPTSVSPTPVPEPARWQVRARVLSEHVLHVGGACRSDWDVQAVLRERDDGRLSGPALATLRGEGGCDFPTADVQTQTLALQVTGRLEGGSPVALRVTLDGSGQPPGSKDLGGFVALMDEVRIPVGSEAPFTIERSDGNDGTYRATWRLGVRCVDGC